MSKPLIFCGPAIHALSPDKVEIAEHAIVEVRDGLITAFHRAPSAVELEKTLSELGHTDQTAEITRLPPRGFLIPGFVDTHNHAPQWAQRGLGQSMHILDWLDKVTFPNEARFADPEYAARIYASAVDGFLRQGITTASYYGSRHAPATKILADLCLAKGQRALVGKCNMSRNAPDYYRDPDPATSLRETEECIAHVRTIDPEGDLVRYVITPRFAITCEDELLAGLGAISRANPDLAVQTHFNEAEQEMSLTRQLFPAYTSECDLYEHFGLLGDRCILAHCCFLDEYEMGRLVSLDCGVAHCPVSNMTVGGGFMAAPVRALLRRGVAKIGLGTDSGGGFSSSILDAMRMALVASNAREVQTAGADRALSLDEVFYLATLGGARVCGWGDKIGSFEVGKEFDALVVDPCREGDGGVMTPVEEGDSLRTVFDKFVMTADDRNIVRVYVRGRLVKSLPLSLTPVA